jgi:hypothetical protein
LISSLLFLYFLSMICHAISWPFPTLDYSIFSPIHTICTNLLSIYLCFTISYSCRFSNPQKFLPLARFARESRWLVFLRPRPRKWPRVFFAPPFCRPPPAGNPPHPRPLPRCARSHFCPPATPSLRSLTFMLTISPSISCFHTPSCVLIRQPGNFFAIQGPKNTPKSPWKKSSSGRPHLFSTCTHYQLLPHFSCSYLTASKPAKKNS